MGVGGATWRSCSWHRAKIRRLGKNVRYAPDFFHSTPGADVISEDAYSLQLTRCRLGEVCVAPNYIADAGSLVRLTLMLPSLDPKHLSGRGDDLLV